MNIRLSLPGPARCAAKLVGLTLGAFLTLHGAAEAAPTNAVLVPKTREPIRPIPLTVKLDARKVALGNKLFHEPRLSKDNTVSCASCHALSKGGADQRVRSVGLNGAEGTINAPTVFNCGLNFKQFWDGRAETLEEQVEGPMQAPAEMGATWEEMVAKLQRVPEYTAAFKAVYANVTQAPAPLDFLDAAVEVHGVCTTIYSPRRQLQGVVLHVPDWKQIKVHETGPKDPFTLPVQPVSALLEFHAGTSGLHRSRINGLVTLRRSDGSFFIQDASGGTLIQLKEPTASIQAGTPMEIVGFPSVVQNLPVLQDAFAKPLSHLPASKPMNLNVESPLQENFHATLVQFDGRVIAHSTRSAEEILTVEFAQSVTDAILEKGTAKAQLAKIVPGSVVRLTGVYVAQLDDSRQVRSFRLLLRSPADVIVISRPPWWTLRSTWWVLGGLSAVLSGALLWVSLLRRQVRRRMLELSEEVEDHERTEAKLEHQTGLLVAEVEQRKCAQTELEEKQAALKKEIDERKRAEMFLNSVLQNLPITVFIKEEQELRFVLWNKAGEELTGYQNKEMVGKNDYDFFPKEQADHFVAKDREALVGGKLVDVEEELLTRHQGTRLVHARKIPILDEAGRPLYLLGIAEDITERKRTEGELKKTQKELLGISRQAGMAEVATSVLHNVGNVLNSVNVSSTLLVGAVQKSKSVNLLKVVALLRAHEADLGDFLTRDPKGRQLPEYLAQLSGHLAVEQAAALQELAGLRKNIEHIKDIVSKQQSYAVVSGVVETVTVRDLVEDALHLNIGSLTRHEVEAVREFADVPPISIEKHKVLQILVNLISNAKNSCEDSGCADKRMTVRVTNGEGSIKIAVSDNGVGIPSENLIRIFNHGFTTRKTGHGFGLHSGALAAKQLGGELRVESAGVGHGATFTIELPVEREGRTRLNAV